MFGLALALLVFLPLAAPVAPAQANEKFAAIAVDAYTGRVIYSRNGDSNRYPASLTKVMTLYVLFEEMRKGRITKDTRIAVSKHAASMPPSKLGLKAGATIRADDAIKVLVTKSANDIAVAVAEAISGSESAFAQRMTKTARRIGMTRTNFANASGLPNPKQISTARDLATLGLRIQRDFPEYYGYFSIRSATVAGATFRSHNKLLRKYRGTDGIKTGYIRASGFNLLASVRRDGKHVVGVMMGGRTGAARDQRIMAMFNDVLPKATAAKGTVVAAAAGDPPNFDKSSVPPAVSVVVPVPPLPVPKPIVTAVTAAPTLAASATGTLSTGKDDLRAISPDSRSSLVSLIQGNVGDEDDEETVAALEETAPEGSAAAEPGWLIQIGAFDTEAGARQRLEKAQGLGLSSLTGKPGFTVSFEQSSKRYYRARFQGFTEEDARKTCQALARHSIDCYPIAPAG